MPVAAQRAAGPFSGILGAVADSDARHTLEVRGSLFGAWDDTLTTANDPALDQRFLRSGGAGGASGSLDHAFRAPRFQWDSSLGSSLRLYGTDSQDRAATYNARTGINTSLSQRVNWSANADWSYSPYYAFAPSIDDRVTPIGAFGGGFNVATAAERNMATAVGSSLGVQLSRRDGISFDGRATRYHFMDQADSNVDTWRVGGRLTHTLSRSLGLYAGFYREEVGYEAPGSSPVKTDSFDFGIDYHDSLVFSLSRRTALSFATSTSAMRWNNATHFRLNGNAALTQSFGRSGSASLNYTRDTDFNAGFTAPLLRDSISAGVSNQVGRKTTWSAVAAYEHGSIGFDSAAVAAGKFDAYNAGGGINVALTRRIGFFTDYSYHRYDVPAGATTFTSLSRFSRQSITAGLSLWAPLIADKRSFRDTR